MKKNLLRVSILTVLIVSLTMVTVVTSPPEPVVDIDPPINSETLGTTFTVNLTVADITMGESLYGWDFGMSFNSSVLNATSVVEGPFLKTGGFPMTTFVPYINNEEFPEIGVAGGYCYGVGFPPTGAYGSGVMAKITFKVIGEGKTHLPIYYSQLANWNGSDYVLITHKLFHGWFLSTLTMKGDIDGDGGVYSQDLELLASSYGTMLGDSGYIWLADLDRDGDVDSSDLHLLARNYGKSVGP